MPYSQIAFCKISFFDLMFTLKSNNIIAFWANKNSTFTFYVIISNNIPSITTFVKEVFDSMFGLESDEMTALQPTA